MGGRTANLSTTKGSVMSGAWHLPLDPQCPEANAFFEVLWADPMTSYSGCGDEIADDFEAKHRAKCKRCQEYGAANVEVGS
jgi:hypothetical protein